MPSSPRSSLLAVAMLSSLLITSTSIAEVRGAAQILSSGHLEKSAPARVGSLDELTVIDANSISMTITNFGSFAYNIVNGVAGFEYPKGSGRTAAFAGGLWLGSENVPGAPRLAIAEYSFEFAPGAMLPSHLPDDASKPEYKVYKLLRNYVTAGARDSALADYFAGAVPHGAPPVTLLGDGSLGILGDQMLWAIYNDANPANHLNLDGSTAPLGVEVQQTTFAYRRSGALDQAIFLEYRIINKSLSALDSMYVALWLDPDLGGFSDDLVGYDSAGALGYCYNATNNDLVYGTNPPALGLGFIRGPVDHSNGNRIPTSSFIEYFNGQDPANAIQTFNNLRGRNVDGHVIVNPVTGLPTTFDYTGDPVAGTGWLDPTPADQRLMLAAGPFHMAAGDTEEFTGMIAIAQASDRLSSITQLRTETGQDRQFILGGADLLGVPIGHDPATLRLAPPVPNPARGVIALAFTLAGAGAARIDVFDIAGRLVLTRDLDGLAPGPHQVSLEMNGRGPGLYFARLSEGAGSISTRFALMR